MYAEKSRLRAKAICARQTGIALLVAIITLALAFALVIGFMELATTDVRIAENQLGFTQSMWAADAGIEYALAGLQRHWATWKPPKKAVKFSDDPAASYTIELRRIGPSFADVSSLGECRGIRTRVRAKVRRFQTRHEITIASWTDREVLASP